MTTDIPNDKVKVIVTSHGIIFEFSTGDGRINRMTWSNGKPEGELHDAIVVDDFANALLSHGEPEDEDWEEP